MRVLLLHNQNLVTDTRQARNLQVDIADVVEARGPYTALGRCSESNRASTCVCGKAPCIMCSRWSQFAESLCGMFGLFSVKDVFLCSP